MDVWAPWNALRDLDERWAALLARFGGRIRRSSDAYVSWLADRRELLVSPDEELDPDDTIAQIVLHELCHFLVEGLASDAHDDWGLDNMSDVHLANEYAALRLQAHLLHTPARRQYLHPTTDHRWFYEALADSPIDDPVHPPTDARSVALAQQGVRHAAQWPLFEALQVELAIADTVISRF